MSDATCPPCPAWCDQLHRPWSDDPIGGGCVHARQLAACPPRPMGPGLKNYPTLGLEIQAWQDDDPNVPMEPPKLMLVIGQDDDIEVALPDLMQLMGGVHALLALPGLEHLAYAATIDDATRAGLEMAAAVRSAPVDTTPPAPPVAVDPQPTATLEDWRHRMVAEGYSKNTMKVRLSTVHAFAQHAGVDPLQLTREHVLDYLAAKDYQPWTRRKYLSHLKAWAAFAGIEDPAGEIRRPATPRGTPRPISEAQLEQLIAAAASNPRQLLFVLLGAYAGFRSFETAKIAVEDLEDAGDGKYRLRVAGKGGRVDVLPCPPRLAAALRSWIDAKAITTGRLFPGASASTVQRSLFSLGSRTGIDFGSHQLRHRYGTAVHAAGGDLLLTQQLMRHASPSTTAGYAAVTRGRGAALVNGLPGASDPAAATPLPDVER